MSSPWSKISLKKSSAPSDAVKSETTSAVLSEESGQSSKETPVPDPITQTSATTVPTVAASRWGGVLKRTAATTATTTSSPTAESSKTLTPTSGASGAEKSPTASSGGLRGMFGFSKSSSKGVASPSSTSSVDSVTSSSTSATSLSTSTSTTSIVDNISSVVGAEKVVADSGSKNDTEGNKDPKLASADAVSKVGMSNSTTLTSSVGNSPLIQDQEKKELENVEKGKEKQLSGDVSVLNPPQSSEIVKESVKPGLLVSQAIAHQNEALKEEEEEAAVNSTLNLNKMKVEEKGKTEAEVVDALEIKKGDHVTEESAATAAATTITNDAAESLARSIIAAEEAHRAATNDLVKGNMEILALQIAKAEEARRAQAALEEEIKEAANLKRIAEKREASELKRIAEEKEASELKRIAEEKEASELKRIAEEKEASELKRIAEEKEASELKRIAEEREASELKRIAEEKEASELKRIAEEREASELKRIAEDREASELKRIAEEKEASELKRIAEEREASELKRIAEEKEASELKRIAEEREASELKRIAEEKEASELKRIAEEREASELKRIAEDREASELKRIAEEKEASDASAALQRFAADHAAKINKSESLSSQQILRETSEETALNGNIKIEDEIVSSANPLVPTTSSAFLSSSLQLTGAVANALADAVAQAVSRVERWQRRAEAQDRIIARLKHEMVIAGMSVSKEERDYYLDEDFSEEEKRRRQDDEDVEKDERVDVPTPQVVQPRIFPVLTPKSSSNNLSPSAKTSATLSLGPNAIALLKQAGYSSQKDIDDANGENEQQNEEAGTEAIESVSRLFPFSDQLISAVALAHAGHPEKLCAEAYTAGVTARTLKVESNVLRSVIDQLRQEHKRRMASFKSIVPDDENEDMEQENEKSYTTKGAVSSKLTKIPTLSSRSTKKPSALTSPSTRGRSRDPNKGTDSVGNMNRFGFSSTKQEAKKSTSVDEVEPVKRSRSKSASMSKRDLTSSLASPRKSQTTTTETTAHSELSLLKMQMQQLQESDESGGNQRSNHNYLQQQQQQPQQQQQQQQQQHRHPIQTATVLKLPSSKAQQGATKNNDASTAAAAAKAQTIARARVDSYKKAGKAGKSVISLLRHRFVGSSTSVSSASSTASDDFSSPALNAASSTDPISIDTISSIPYFEPNSPQQSHLGLETSSFLSSIDSSPTTTVRVADGGVLTVTSSGKLYAQHVIESPERSKAEPISSSPIQPPSQVVRNVEGVVNSPVIPTALREMLDRLARSAK
jgi:hypothetical protein